MLRHIDEILINAAWRCHR